MLDVRLKQTETAMADAFLSHVTQTLAQIESEGL